jgi:hypothetical protein
MRQLLPTKMCGEEFICRCEWGRESFGYWFGIKMICGSCLTSSRVLRQWKHRIFLMPYRNDCFCMIDPVSHCVIVLLRSHRRRPLLVRKHFPCLLQEWALPWCCSCVTMLQFPAIALLHNVDVWLPKWKHMDVGSLYRSNIRSVTLHILDPIGYYTRV